MPVSIPGWYNPKSLYDVDRAGELLNGSLCDAMNQLLVITNSVRELAVAHNQLEAKLDTIISAISREVEALSEVAPKTVAALAELTIDNISKD